MKMTAGTGFLTEDFAEGLWVIYIQALDFPQLYLLLCLSSKLENFGLDWGLVLIWHHSLFIPFLQTSPLPVLAGQVRHNVVLDLTCTLWVLSREIKAAVSRQKASDPTLLDKDKNTLFCDWDSLLIYTDLFSSWTSTVSKTFRAMEASLHPCISSMGWNWRLFLGGSPLGALCRSDVLTCKWVNFEDLGCCVNADS